MGETELVALIGNMGFPMAVAVFLLWKFSGIIENNTKVLNMIANKMNIKEGE